MPNQQFRNALSVLILSLQLIASAAYADGKVADNSVLIWNATLIEIIRLTSAQLVDGPPEVAREIAIVDTAMLNAAKHSRSRRVSANVAALVAGDEALRDLFDSSAPNATPLASLWSNSPTLKSVIDTAYGTALANYNIDVSSHTFQIATSIGQREALRVLRNRSTDHSLEAILNGLMTYVPPGSGTVGRVSMCHRPPGRRCCRCGAGWFRLR